MPHQMLARARALRSNPTEAERRFWNVVRRDRLGVRFRRQHRIGDYIVDFVCFDWRLIVEIDGGQHGLQSSYDARRDAWLESRGFTVMRFWNSQILREPGGVVERILATSRVGGEAVAR